MRDDELMGRAIELARGARRRTAPWPAVGCVIARDGEIVGEGATGPFPAGSHAEVAALRAAGRRAHGAAVFTTLEPCDHHGNTPPCTEALVDAGVARVVAALVDPDEKVRGRGCARLRDAGIDVSTGIGARDAARDLAPYLHHRRTGRAYVVVKLASSLDGRVAARDGSSRWITGDAARRDAHELRADSQAVVVGAGTALADRPMLTVRDVEELPARPPLRVVLDARGRVPAEGPLFDTAAAATLVITTEAAPPGVVDGWRAAGAKVEMIAPAPGGGVDLAEALALLGREGVLQAMCEGGPTLTGALLDGGHVGRIVAYLAPTFLGRGAVAGIATDRPATLADATRFRLSSVRALDDDVRIDLDVLGAAP